MRYVSIVLLALLAVVHADLWLGKGGVSRTLDLRGKLAVQHAANQVASARNAQLAAEVRDLREGLEMVEEKARFELGMIKPDEILVQMSAPGR